MILPVFEHGLPQTAFLPKAEFIVKLDAAFVEGTPPDILTAPNIKKVYGAEVCVYPHPINKLPTTLITAGGSHGTS
jgi:ABC-type hemin transport system ATPase subunit